VLLAELDIFHSRPIVPTRRLAIDRTRLHATSNGHAPTPGSLLLGAVCARFSSELAYEALGEVTELVHELELNQPIAQPRLRHRLQSDRVGLSRSRQRLYGNDTLNSSGSFERLSCEFESARATPSQLILGAVYAAGMAATLLRSEALRAVRQGLAWRGDVGPALFAYLSAGDLSIRSDLAVSDPVGWALDILGLERADQLPEHSVVRRCFREALRAAHPDLGAAAAEAADRIAELSEARRILLVQ